MLIKYLYNGYCNWSIECCTSNIISESTTVKLGINNSKYYLQLLVDGR